MDWTPLSLKTLVTQIPKVVNDNFTATENYIDTFYDEAGKVIIKPVNTTGRVKAATGQFVNAIVDNLTVKTQYTNLYDNITTADGQYYTMLTGNLTIPRDPCTFGIDTSSWSFPYEPSAYKILEVDQPYYKISNDNGPIYMINNNLSQIVGILFADPSGTQNYEIVLDPCAGTVYSVAVDSSGAQQYMEFIVESYDASWGPTWSQYRYGVEDPCTGVSTGFVLNGTVGNLAMYTDTNSVGDSPITIVGSDMWLDGDISVGDVIIHNAIRDSSGDIILGYGSPIQLGSSTNSRQVNIYTGGSEPAMIIGEDNSIHLSGNLDVSGNIIITQGTIEGYLAEASINYYPSGPFIWSGGLLDVSIADVVGATVAYVDGSLATRDLAISQNATDIGDVSTRIPTDFYSQTYVDGSLNAKQDIIADGTFLKESSIGSGLVWNAGSLDVSVAGGGGTGDVAWANGNFGSNNNILTAAGDGSIWSESWVTANFVTKEFRVDGSTTLVGPLRLSPTDIPTGTAAVDEILFLDSDNRVKRTSLPSVPVTSYTSGASDRVITGTSATGITGETTLTYDGTNRILTVSPSTSTGVGVARLGMVNHAGSGNDPGDYLYSGFAWFSDNGSFPPPGEGPALIMKNWHDGDSHYGYGHIVIDRLTGALHTKYYKTTTDAGAANGGTWRTIPYQTGTTSNGIVTRVSSTANVVEANMRFSGTNLQIYNGATENVRITNTGFIYADQDVVAYSTLVSDERLKDNIEPLSGSLDKILQLEGVSYDRKKDGSKHLGLIAQDVEDIVPEVVKEQELPLEGEEGELYKTLNYVEIIPLLIEGMKEQQEMINELKAEIEILKNK